MASSIDDYIGDFPPDVQEVLQRIRQTIADAAPSATEAISYGIPTFLLDGRYLLYFAGWKRHVSIYPIPRVDAQLAKDIAAYQGGKGTLKFPLGAPIPYELIGRVAAAALRDRQQG